MNVTTVTIKAVLCRGYTYSAAHDNLDDIAGGLRVSTSAAIGSFTVVDNIVDCADFSFAAVPAGAACEAIVFFRDTGVESTSTLIMYYDAAPMPVTPNGEAINVTIDAASPNLFRLGSAG